MFFCPTLLVLRSKKLLCIILFFITWQQSFAQSDKRIDSLMKILNTATEDTSKVNALNNLSRYYLQRAQHADAKKYANEALTLATKKNFKKGMAASYNAIGSINSNQGNYAVAMENFQTSLTIRKDSKDTAGVAAIHSDIGEVYIRMGNYSEAMNNIFISLRLAEKIGDKKRIALCYEKWGIILSRQKKLSEAFKKHLEALRIREEINDKPGIGSSNTNIGLIYGMLGDDEEALSHHLTALKIKRETGEKAQVAVCHQNIGLIYARQGKFSEALEEFRSSLRINEEIRDKRSIAFCCSNIGDIYIRSGQCNEARNYLNKGLSISIEIGTKSNTRDIYRNLSKLDSAVGNFQQAFIDYKLYTDYKDSLLNENTNKQIEDLKEQYESEKREEKILQLENEKKINSLQLKATEDSLRLITSEKNKVQLESDKIQLENEKARALNLYNQQQIEKDKTDYALQKAESDKKKEQLAISDLRLKKQKQTTNYFIAGLILFAILSFFVYRSYHTRQKLKLLTLRNKIASDLHDDVGSTLSSISIFSQMAQQQSKETIPMLETIGESSRKMLDAMADIVWTVKPENDQFEKIIMRMRNFAYELLGAKKIDFEFIADEDVEKFRLPMEVRKNLYLIFKEATNNIVKYSEARRAMFSIKGEKNNLTMIIRDNGKGFNINAFNDGNGLKNMKKRAKEIGANFIIDSHPGDGTVIQLQVAV